MERWSEPLKQLEAGAKANLSSTTAALRSPSNAYHAYPLQASHERTSSPPSSLLRDTSIVEFRRHRPRVAQGQSKSMALDDALGMIFPGACKETRLEPGPPPQHAIPHVQCHTFVASYAHTRTAVGV